MDPTSPPRAVLQTLHNLLDHYPRWKTDKRFRKAFPRTRDDGSPEWTTLAAVIAWDCGSDTAWICCATTGVKCLPDELLPMCHGQAVHDCHAEILAGRAFSAYILSECEAVMEGSASGLMWFDPVTGKYYKHENVYLYLFISEVPCGDASLAAIVARQSDQSEWEADDRDFVASEGVVLRGRAQFLRLGVVRTKPGRRDSPITMSKSCSDKLAVRQVTSVLVAVLPEIVAPDGMYYRGLILPRYAVSATDDPEKKPKNMSDDSSDISDKIAEGHNKPQTNSESETENCAANAESQILQDLHRCFHTRFAKLETGNFASSYKFHPLRLHIADVSFLDRQAEPRKPSVVSAVMIFSDPLRHSTSSPLIPRTFEALANGMKVGCRNKFRGAKREKFAEKLEIPAPLPSGTSELSRFAITRRVASLKMAMSVADGSEATMALPETYVAWKRSLNSKSGRDGLKLRIGELLGGICHTSEDDFPISVNCGSDCVA